MKQIQIVIPITLITQLTVKKNTTTTKQTMWKKFPLSSLGLKRKLTTVDKQRMAVSQAVQKNRQYCKLTRQNRKGSIQ